MSLIQHGVRVGLLMIAVAGLLLWLSYHSDATFADGLRYINQAQRIEQGAWSEGLIKSVDHPLHSMGIAAVHRVLGGTDPVSWQRSAQIVSAGAMILLVIPLYLLGRWRSTAQRRPGSAACSASATRSPGFIVINVLSECSFLLFWTWGALGGGPVPSRGPIPLAPADDRVSSALAYLTRPEGMLLPLALVATLLVLPSPLGDSNLLAPLVGRGRVHGSGSLAARRSCTWPRRGAGDETLDRPAARHRRRNRTPWRWSGNARWPRTRPRSRPTESRPGGCSRSCGPR